MKLFALIALCALAHGAVLQAPTQATISVIAESPRATTRPGSTRPGTTRTSRTSVFPVSPTSVPNTLPPKPTLDPGAQANRQHFNDITRRIWDTSAYTNKTTRYLRNSTHDISNPAVRKELERRDPAFGDWTAEGFCESDWGWWLHWYKPCCHNSNHHDYETGQIMKSVVKETYRTYYKYWWNETEIWKYRSDGPSECRIGWGWDTQCQNWVWVEDGAYWDWMTEYNYGDGWSTNNATYDGHTVRTIYDCLLDRVAVEYYDEVYAFGYAPIQYYLNGIKYFRFYDENDFAWFIACPASWQKKGRNVKRQGLGRNSNPVWDFGVWDQRHELSDMTWYPEDLIPDFDSDTSYTAMYWPEGDDQIIEVDDWVCQQMAVSRPGLRHWTARLVDIPPETYPPITSEKYYPAGWSGYTRWSWSWLDNAFTW